MKHAVFWIASLALHALALAYPIPFRDASNSALIPITIFSQPQSSNVRGAGTPAADAHQGDRIRKILPNPAQREHRASFSNRDREQNHKPGPVDGSALAAASLEGGTSPVSLPDTAAGSPASSREGDSGGPLAGEGTEFLGTGLAPGGQDGGATIFAQAKYGYAPTPAYPERAREQGKQGRVLLRVLVDEQGRSKAIEVSRSSGNDALDQAAREAIKDWRFSPARYRDQPVESWVKIPIDFRLTDKNN